MTIKVLKLTVSSREIWQRVVALFLGHETFQHLDIVAEGVAQQAFDDDVRQMVREEHEALPAVLHQVFVVLLLIVANLTNWNEGNGASYNYLDY